MNQPTQSLKLRSPASVGVIVASTVICFSLAAGISSQNQPIRLDETPGRTIDRTIWPLQEQSRELYNKPLGGNYRIIRTSNSEVVILRRSALGKDSSAEKQFIIDPTMGTFVGGNIKLIAARPPYVTGYAVILPDMENTEDQAGFFVLDTEKDVLREGMDKHTWDSELEKIEWHNPPLVSPP